MDQKRNPAEWFLEGYLGETRALQRWTIERTPYRVGRHPEMDLSLPSRSVSGRHAELYLRGHQLWVRDLDSTNGTFVNRRRVDEEMELQEGDVLHFSECEFRVGRLHASSVDASHTVYADLSESKLPGQMAVGVREFRQMLITQAVRPHFQPIVELASGERFGYEILGRGDLEGLTDTPGDLFRIAASLGLESELSRLFRLRGMDEAGKLGGTPKIFLNSHPSEMGTGKLLNSLKVLRQKQPRLPLVLEIHETAVTDLAQMRELRAQLQALAIELAYDDFGAGQTRLQELAEVPPEYLKFDRGLIHDIDRAASPKRKMVASLVHIGRDMGVCCLAEGIETEEERAFCFELGFHSGQGYLFGRPAPVEHWIG